MLSKEHAIKFYLRMKLHAFQETRILKGKDFSKYVEMINAELGVGITI